MYSAFAHHSIFNQIRMKNIELIAKLKQLPDDLEVAVVDLQRNLHDTGGQGDPSGIYQDFDVFEIKNEDDPTFVPWVAIGFSGEPFNVPSFVRRCRKCGCTDYNCETCIQKTGRPCYWVEEDLCSACMPTECKPTLLLPGIDF
jgi:hypothetical protein